MLCSSNLPARRISFDSCTHGSQCCWCRNEERKARLREAATGIAESGQDQRVFEDSNYAMSEEARTPNVHSRQVHQPASYSLSCINLWHQFWHQS